MLRCRRQMVAPSLKFVENKPFGGINDALRHMAEYDIQDL